MKPWIIRDHMRFTLGGQQYKSPFCRKVCLDMDQIEIVDCKASHKDVFLKSMSKWSFGLGMSEMTVIGTKYIDVQWILCYKFLIFSHSKQLFLVKPFNDYHKVVRKVKI
jgi:hypothetical protein